MKTIFSCATLLLLAAKSSATFVVSPVGDRPKTALSQSFHPGYGIKDWQNNRVPASVYTEPVTKSKIMDEINAKRKAGEPKVESILDPSFALTYVVAMVGPYVSTLHPGGPASLLATGGNCFHLLLAALLWVQTCRVRCVFESDGIEFYNLKGAGLNLKKGARLERKPGNFVVGTDNRWKYDNITGYQFFPSISLPVICVLKEKQTGEGKQYYGEQPHFFPALFDAQMFKAEMDQRGVKYGL